jgi:hypothetical protein
LDAKKKAGRRVDRLARAIINAAIELHRVLGSGFGENVYAFTFGGSG